MNKGKLGISLPFYAVLAFIFAAFGGAGSILMLLGFVLIVEKDVWTTKQVIQALLLDIFGSSISVASSLLSNAFIYRIPGLGSALSTVFSYANNIFYVIVTLFAIYAITRVKAGKDAGIPFAAKVSDWACGQIQ